MGPVSGWAQSLDVWMGPGSNWAQGLDGPRVWMGPESGWAQGLDVSTLQGILTMKKGLYGSSQHESEDTSCSVSS